MRTPVSRIEYMAGLLVLLGLVALAALILYPGIRTESLLNPFILELRANEGKEITEGNKVMIQGVQVGTVVNVELDHANHVIIECRIKERYEKFITSGTKVKLVPPAIVGSSQVHIFPGSGAPLSRNEATLEAEPATSLVETAAVVLEGAQSTLKSVDQLVEQSGQSVRQLEKLLYSTENILKSITMAQGSFGRFLYDEEIYARLVSLLGRLAQSTTVYENVLSRLDDFTTLLPSVRTDIDYVTKQARHIMKQLGRASDHVPETIVSSTATVREGRKVVESLKRNFLIRGNLPRDSESRPMAPASDRDVRLSD